MNRLKNYSKVVYDAQIIVYYSFQYEKYKLTGRTTKTRDLTQFLTNMGLKYVSHLLSLMKSIINQFQK